MDLKMRPQQGSIGSKSPGHRVKNKSHCEQESVGDLSHHTPHTHLFVLLVLAQGWSESLS